MVPFLGPYYNTGPNLGDPKRDHNFDNPPRTGIGSLLGGMCIRILYIEINGVGSYGKEHT